MKKNIFIFFAILCICFNHSSLSAQLAIKSDVAKGGDTFVPDRKAGISTAFDPQAADWDISWPGVVSQYDLVYKSPPIDPMQGIPLGNGEIAALFWCEGSKIIAVVNKSDLWDDAKPDTLDNWGNENCDQYTTQRHACRIIIDFQFPVFNTLYLSGFNARLNLADASMTMEAASPFGEVGLKAFIDHKTGTLFYELNSDLNEDVPVEVAVERYGSRTFSGWYHQINRDAAIGLSGTDSFAGDESIFITQKLSSGTFAVGGTVIRDNGLEVSYSREHSRRVLTRLSGNSKKNVQFAFVVTSPGIDNPVIEVKESLFSIKQKGVEPFRKSNTEAWKTIWDRSFMDYGDDYLNNLWYLTMYYANASQGGKYPGRFNNGLWGWSHDVQNWNFYFHWNQQQLCWPLNAAGFHELVTPYLDFRFNSLPQAKKDAKKFFDSGGAFISDVTNRNGYNSPHTLLNHTPVAEIALDFWRQYQYTGDKKFLEKQALPFILEAARFFESLLVKEDDGLYHAKEGTGYEGWIRLKDGLTELVYAEVLFSTALEAVKVAGANLPEVKMWEDILGNLAPLPVVKASKGLIARGKEKLNIAQGIFKGASVSTDDIVSAGWGIKEKKWLATYFDTDDPAYSFFSEDSPAYSIRSKRNGLKLLDGIFPAVPNSPVFPSGLVGLSQKDSNLFDVMTATTLLYGTECTGWDPVPIVLARLGLSEELAVDLDNFPSRWQIYCNGWGHWGMEGLINEDAELFFKTNTVKDINSDEKLPLRMWPFRHMSMESMSVLSTAMNESLLQSYDGILRVFPAFPDDKTGRFTLHAVGGFVVSAEIREGEVQWVSVKSLLGNPCRLELPWSEAFVRSTLKKRVKTVSGEITEVKTKAGEVIVFTQEEESLRSWTVESEKPQSNEKVKYHPSGKTQLGIPRMF
ncbi:glycosyl hydrolase family 95 catalytic domain-containing protein [Mariniphaga sediminis]|nr:hypothetical protein [Mariniphaga sediminis]